MGEAVGALTNTYLQTGFMGMFCIVVMILVIWYFVKGRKEQEQNANKTAEQAATTQEVIRNNTEALHCTAEVIKMYGQTSTCLHEDMQRFDGRMTRQGEQLDGICTDVKLALDRLRDK